MLPVNGFVGSLMPCDQKPAIPLLVQVGLYIVWSGRPPVFGMMPRIGCLASPAYRQPSSFENHAPLLLPPAKTRFLSKQTVPASLSHMASYIGQSTELSPSLSSKQPWLGFVAWMGEASADGDTPIRMIVSRNEFGNPYRLLPLPPQPGPSMITGYALLLS